MSRNNPDSHPARARLLTILLLTAALLSLLGIGALNQRRAFLTRGIPDTLPGPIPHGGAQIGLNVALLNAPDPAAELAQIADLGITTVKQTFYFQPDFDWDAADRLMTAVSAQGITLVPLLDGNPADNFAPPDPAAYAAWAGAFAARYGDQIQYVILWDEPNLTSHWGMQPVNPVDYAALLTAAAAAVRAADADAVIVAAPLAPTVETGPQNLAEPLFLKSLYEAGAGDAFDVVAAKPYGFDSGPADRAVAVDRLNLSRVILLRELMAAQGDGHKAIWAGNWGWNSLPSDWNGAPSIWGHTDEAQQSAWTIATLDRARTEWPWMGLMFLENWRPDAPADDPRWGFSIAGRETAAALQTVLAAAETAVAPPGFHLASADDPAQQYVGGWEFSPEFGADISETPPDAPGDQVTITFWGTDLGVRVRRADYRARLLVTVDGAPANALPHDSGRATLVLTAPDAAIDELRIEPVAVNLAPGVHTATIVADRGWDQWALNGFSVGYTPPPDGWTRWGRLGLALLAVTALAAAAVIAPQGAWRPWLRRLANRFHGLQQRAQWAITAVTAALVALTGWLTWGEQAIGMYRRLGDGRLGDGGQLALTAAAAAIFYVTPTFFVYVAALAVLLFLIYLRPAWGLALVAFTFPFYVQSLTKPIFAYRFSPTEVFTLITFAAFLLAQATAAAGRLRQTRSLRALWPAGARLHPADFAVLAFGLVATLSLLFTERLDVATNEWRVVILEPILFYVMLRGLRLDRQAMWTILDAFVVGGLVVAGVGLWQYATGSDLLITAEGGLMRLRAFYGSPNNVGLYLGRVLPLLAAVALLGTAVHGRRRWVYAALLLPLGVATLLTFSRGAILIGLPAAFLFIFWQWQRLNGRRTWPWVLASGALAVVGLFVLLQLPQFAGRFDLRGQTSFFRINLWRASVNMFLEHPVWGVGLDNFLYAYRGRYILAAAWQEPDLNHPHNLVLDFATRLGLLGLISGAWMMGWCGRLLWWARRRVSGEWLPVAVGLLGALIDMVGHGLVDHSFFLVDLAFGFFLLLGTAVWLARMGETETTDPAKAPIRA